MNKEIFFICIVSIQIAGYGCTNSVEKGRKLHDTYCEVCHSIGESKTNEESTLLVGQDTAYLKSQLIDIAAGSIPTKREMAKETKKFLDKEGEAGLDALLSFYASQQR